MRLSFYIKISLFPHLIISAGSTRNLRFSPYPHNKLHSSLCIRHIANTVCGLSVVLPTWAVNAALLKAK